MTQRKFKPETTGGYWVRNVEDREAEGPYTLKAQIGNHSSQPPFDDQLDWTWETFTADGKYFSGTSKSPFDLIEETENE